MFDQRHAVKGGKCSESRTNQESETVGTVSSAPWRCGRGVTAAEARRAKRENGKKRAVPPVPGSETCGEKSINAMFVCDGFFFRNENVTRVYCFQLHRFKMPRVCLNSFHH